MTKVYLDGKKHPADAGIKSGDMAIFKGGVIFDFGSRSWELATKKNGKLVPLQDVTITCDDSTAKPTIKFRGPTDTAAIRDSGINNTIQGIRADVGANKNFLINNSQSVGGSLIDCWLVPNYTVDYGNAKYQVAGYGLQIGLNVGTKERPYKIIRSGSKVPLTGGCFYFGGRNDGNPWSKPNFFYGEDLVTGVCLREHSFRCHFVGAGKLVRPRFEQLHEHPLFTWHMVVKKIAKRGASLNIRDGQDIEIIDPVVAGQQLYGPLADADGGINIPPGPERDRMMALRLKNVSITNMQMLAGYVTIQAGVDGLTLNKVTGISTGQGGFMFTIKDPSGYGERPAAKNLTVRGLNVKYINLISKSVKAMVKFEK